MLDTSLSSMELISRSGNITYLILFLANQNNQNL